MKLLYVTVVLALLVACDQGWKPPENPDPKQILDEAQSDFKEQRYEDALAKHVWFHDHALEYEPSKMYGVRLSFALSYWKQLGDVYPPALKTLKMIRGNKSDLVAQGKGNRNLFHDVMALNRTLGEDNRTVELFRMLDQNQPDLAKQCWSISKKTIFDANAYDLVKKYIENLVSEFDSVKEIYDRNKAMYGGENFGESFESYNENSFVDATINLINVAVAIDDIAAAKEIQKRAISILNVPRLTDAIPTETK